MEFITFQFQIRYETHPGEEIYVYGDCPDFGSWKHPKFRLRWSKGHIWKADYELAKSSGSIKFKFVCHSNTSDKWEEGENRLLSPKNLNGLSKTPDGKYILDCVWNHFKINFNIHYVPSNPNSFMQVVGAPDALSNWQKTNEKPVKMELRNDKEITAKDGNKITGFWTVTALMKNSDKRNLDFEYRYSLFDPKSGTAIWEREPNRHLHFFLTEDEIASFDNPSISPDSCYLLTNSFLEILDVNFVANLVFNRMGEKKIYIGPYPQSENDFKIIAESGIDSILNVQSDKDLIFRQINHQLQLKQAKNLGITINRYPIEDFNQEDLFEKLKGAGDLLNKLIKEGKTVYVHCTAGMSRAAATVIIYLVLYENYTVEDATNFCKKHRPVICPNYGVINRIASIYKPGSEMSGGSMFNFTPSSFQSKVQKEIDKENAKEIAREKERRRLRELKRQERIMKEKKLREEKEKEKITEESPTKKIVKKKIKVKVKKVKKNEENETGGNNDKINEEKKNLVSPKILEKKKLKNNSNKIINIQNKEEEDEKEKVKKVKKVEPIKKEIIKEDNENIPKEYNKKKKIIKKVKIIKKKKLNKNNEIEELRKKDNENEEKEGNDVKKEKEENGLNKNEKKGEKGVKTIKIKKIEKLEDEEKNEDNLNEIKNEKEERDVKMEKEDNKEKEAEEEKENKEDNDNQENNEENEDEEENDEE